MLLQEKPSQPAPVYHPVTRQLEFPLSRQTACTMMQSMLRCPPACLARPAPGQKRPAPDLDPLRTVKQCATLSSMSCPALPSAGLNGQASAFPNEAAPPAIWSVQVWPAPPNCVMG